MSTVLVVDDSYFVRKTLKKMIEGCEGFDSVKTVKSGEKALELLENGTSVDLVTLDVLMPGMDGLEVLKKVKTNYPDIPVIMISSTTGEETSETTQALSYGAEAAIQKPSDSITGDIQKIQDDLENHLQVLVSDSKTNIGSPWENVGTQKGEEDTQLESKFKRVNPEIVLIGGSTGALPVIRSIFEHLDPDRSISFAVVQHIAGPFLNNLPDTISGISSLSVQSVTETTELEPGTIFFPGAEDLHLTVRKNQGELILRPSKSNFDTNACPSVDVLFESAYRALGKDTIAVLLSGMGEDGAMGMERLHGAGALCMAQDRESSAVFGMPKAAIKKGAIDMVVPGSEIPEQLSSWINNTRANKTY